MTKSIKNDRPVRLSKAERHKQLLRCARAIARDEGVDRLTLGRLSGIAGVSKPVVYDHFPTRTALLTELYKWLDAEQVDAFRQSMAAKPKCRAETVNLLAQAYIRCAADTKGEVYNLGAALAGSQEKSAVVTDCLDYCVGMFVAVLAPHSSVSEIDLVRRCVGLVGAGEALAASLIQGRGDEAEIVAAFGALIRGSLEG
ncbi:TetR/AcrR family transcriptional regulator [Oryzicola mucosus]|uniref:TetR/AcrR family transcriptional regulator n=1 Tax=Oryzicola mucosus TaxID=2767425 RepID=A0A8J6U758_9HYPH|nr:TetR/AcrR family transcriptional regulator [Oryzicola mucosus]MBD0414297.1 TetR/AcrR family transcriptional regulator [Oryzicola mucosus]